VVKTEDDQAQVEGDEAKLERVWSRPPGFRGWLMTVNNQPLGKRYMITSLAFFGVAGVMALILRIQLAVSDNEWLHPDTFNALFTMHGSTMMYLFAVPFLEGLALYLMPLMIGSRDVAFPRLTALSYWMYLSGGLVMYASFFFGTVPDAGWFAYTPLSGPQFADRGLDFWLLGLGLVEAAALAAAVEIVVTLLKMRAPGMAIHRMPLAVWAFLIAGVMIVFGFTPLLTATMMLELDRTLGTHFFNPLAGGSSLLWQHLFWFFGHPEVYIIFIPATGVLSTVIPVFARRPLVGYALIVVALVVMGFLSFGLWVHHMFTTGLPQLSLIFFAGASFMIALASGVQVFAWIATLWGSRPSYQTPLLYVLGFFFIFVIGGITGVMVATIPFDQQVHDTYFIVAHLHYVLIGGAVFPMLAGLYYWFPKITGKLPGEPWGKAAFWLTFIGFNVTFAPMHWMGMFGLPRRVYTYPADLGLDAENMVATAGAFVIGIGFAMALGGLVWSAWRGRSAGCDPWGSGTLEWGIESPPRRYSFRQPPVVRGRYPLWQNEGADVDADALERVAEGLRDLPVSWRASLVTDLLTARPQVVQHLPGPSIVPLVTAAGILAAASAVLAEAYVLALLGAMFSAGVVAVWLWPRRLRLPEREVRTITEQTGLPVVGTGSRSTAWWGAVGLVTILGTAMGSLVYSYFYLRLYSEQWPQDGLALPELMASGIGYALLLVSAGVQVWVSRSFRRETMRGVIGGLVGIVLLGLGFIGLVVWALVKEPTLPTDNAYTSALFVINWMMLGYAAVGVAVTALALPRLVWWPSDDARRLRVHLEVAELLWWFVVGAGVVAFGTTYVSPHVM
jgi:cytochrome c oxidase subunit I+III